MPMPTAAQAASNWAQGMAGSTAKLQAGIQAVSESPMEKAANAKDRYVAGVNRAAADGSYESGLRAVSLQQWKEAALNKGVARVAAGAQQAKGKMQSFMEKFLPVLASNVAALPPRGDLQQNIQRAVQLMQANSQFKNK